jgi:hypothetical protein
MREELNSKLGFYNSAFLKMHIHSTEDLQKLEIVSIQTEATYLHEYIHFLQDISSTYGLMNICSIVDYIKLTNNNTLSKKLDEVKVPFEPEVIEENDVKANWQLKRIYLGGGIGLNDVNLINSIYKCIEPVSSNKGQINVEKVIVDFSDSQGNSYKYTIGAYCVSESMAYEIEQILYPAVLPKPAKMPYESIRIMCDYLMPGFSETPLNIIALCDSCMMLFNPGVFVFDTLCEMVRVGFIPQSPESVYHFVYSNVSFNHYGHSTVQQLLISTAASSIGQLSDYFTTPLFKYNREWINYEITSAVDLRISNPFFILDIVRGGSILSNDKVNNKFFVNLLHKLGSPIVVNDEGDMTFIQPTPTSYETRSEYFWVFDQIYKMYQKGITHDTYKCEMIDYCNLRAKLNGVEEYTDENCRYSPWLRAKADDPNPCLFGQVWKTWGLENVIVKSNQTNEA